MKKDWDAMREVLDQVDSRIRQAGWAHVAQEDRDAANVDAFYGRVLNGGLDSLFFNSPYLGDMADELLASLERVGAVHAAEFVREAFTFFPQGRVPSTLDARVHYLRKSGKADPFEAVNRRFYAEAEKEESVLLAFFRSHSKHFVLHDK
jgi:hypothetical protein